MLNFIKKWFKSSKNKKNEEIPAEQFFSSLKEKKNDITVQALNDLFEQNKILMNRMIRSGQIDAADRLMFHLKNIKREQEAIEAGYTKYVYRDDIDFFIDKVAKQTVKVIDIESYERAIPEDITQAAEKARPYFDQLYVLFTDYTGKEDRKVELKNRTKDPILFGAFYHKDYEGNRLERIIWNHKFYYIADWVDEYCDLTLDKFVSMMNLERHDSVHVAMPALTLDELQNQLDILKQKDEDNCNGKP